MADEDNGLKPVLGLPYGSVRAILTLLIVAVVIYRLIRLDDIELLWTETLMIALAHYFTSRRFIKLPPQEVHRLAEEGHVEKEVRPLFLPRHSIRAILILAFVGASVYLYRIGHLLDPRVLAILGVVFPYFLGIVIRFNSVRRWEDLKAGVVLLVMAVTATFYLMDNGDMLPHFWRNLTLGLVLFYFGSR